MSRANWKFTGTEVKRAIVAAESTGLAVRGVEIGKAGEIRLKTVRDPHARPILPNRVETASPPKAAAEQ